MEVIKTAIEGVVIIEPRVFKDARGYFFESFSQKEFEEKVRKMAILMNGQVRMANMAIVAGFSVNGVAQLHLSLIHI